MIEKKEKVLLILFKNNPKNHLQQASITLQPIGLNRKPPTLLRSTASCINFTVYILNTGRRI